MSDNPFSAPTTAPTSISPDNKKSKRMMAFIFILIVWYWGIVFDFSILMFSHVFLVFAIARRNGFAVDSMVLLCLTELAFVLLLFFAWRRRSYFLTLAVLAFSFCWSVVNIIAAAALFTNDGFIIWPDR